MDVNKYIITISSNVEVALELPKGIISNFYTDDDWSFIIKIHALIESALTSAIIRSIPQSTLTDQISHLPTSQSKIGKIYFAEKMGLITKEQRLLIVKISEIRNELIHNIRNINNSISQYYNKSLENSINNAQLSILKKYVQPSKLKNMIVLSKDPKQNIFLATMTMIIALYGKSVIIQEFLLKNFFNK